VNQLAITGDKASEKIYDIKANQTTVKPLRNGREQLRNPRLQLIKGI